MFIFNLSNGGYLRYSELFAKNGFIVDDPLLGIVQPAKIEMIMIRIIA